MAICVDRSAKARKERKPDVFLSHSSRDKEIVRQLAEDLNLLQVDAWLDEWEIQAGDSLAEVVGSALEASRYVAVILGDNFADSRWARDEMKQALARERRLDSGIVLPVLCGNAELPSFLEEKAYLDLREDNYYSGLLRLAAIVHGLSRQRTEHSIQLFYPKSISDCLEALRYCGIEPYAILDMDDWQEIAAIGAKIEGDVIRFSPEYVAAHPSISPRLRDLMWKLSGGI